MTALIDHEPGVFRLTFEHDPAVIRAITALPGRRHDWGTGAWLVPEVHAAALSDLADVHGWPCTEAAREALTVTPPPTVGRAGDAFTVAFPYDAALMAAVTRIPGSKWMQSLNAWVVPKGQLAAINDLVSHHGAVLDDDAATLVADLHAIEAVIAKSGALSTEWQVRPGMGLDLYPPQVAGVDYAVNVAGGRCIIGDEPGVGKTLQAMAVLHELDAFPAVVVCPAGIKINWMRELQRALPNKSIEVLNGVNPRPRLLWADVTIVNYDILPAWVDELPAIAGVIVDEGHYIKNPNTLRSQAALKLCSGASKASIVLTGTPVLNETKEAFPLITAIGRENDFGGPQMSVLYRNHPLDFNRALKSTCYVRRRKADAYADMPGRHWRKLIIEGDPAVMEEYRQAEADIVKYLAGKARAIMEEAGASDDETHVAVWQARMRAEAAEQLVAMNHLRQLAARARMPGMMAWARDFLQGGEKLSLWGWHKEFVGGAADALNAVRITGGMKGDARQQSIDLFQDDPRVRAVACQIIAAGEGVTLTAGSTALFMEQAWNPGKMDQALDRHHRLGQTQAVFGYVALADGTVDGLIYDLIAEKRIEVDAATDGIAPDRDAEVHILQDLTVALAERGLRD